MQKFDVISIGDSTIDVFLDISDAQVLCNLDKKGCKLCISYADKIAVNKMERRVAGNTANNAVASSRLGLKTAIFTNVGSDESGSEILEKLKSEKVDTSLSKVNPGMNSNFSTVINFDKERTILVYHQPWKYSLPALPESKWVYYTSSGKGFETLHKPLISYLRKNGVKLGLNLGTHQRKAPMNKIRDIIAQTDAFFFNKEEACDLLGLDYDAKFKDLLVGIKKMGPKVVIITDGPKGSTCYDGENFYQLGIYTVPVIQRTGVGDSYASAFIAALQYGKSIEDAMKWGTLNASGVVQHIGPQEGLRTKAEIERIMKSKPKFTKSAFW